MGIVYKINYAVSLGQRQTFLGRGVAPLPAPCTYMHFLIEIVCDSTSQT